MTAFDIYSAIGGVGEDILEESETVPKRKLTKIIPLMAAAACFAVVAVGLSHTLRSGDIEQPVTEINSITTYPASDESESPLVNTYPAVVTEPPATGYKHPMTGSGGDESIIDQPPSVSSSTETAEMFTEPYPPVTEETAAETAETENTSAEEEEEAAIIPKWEDMDDLERYIYLDYKGNTYGITMEHFDESELTFLQNCEIFGVDEYTDKKYSMECAVYKIDNIDDEYMAAVMTADGLYTGFKRERFWYDTLGEAVEGTGILKRNIIGDTVSISDDDARQTTVYTVPNLQQAAEKLLNYEPDTAVHVNPPDDCGTVNYRVYGKDGKWLLTVYETGYVYFGVSHFNPGAEYAKEFIDYVKQNSTDIEAIPYDEPNADDPVIPE